jgi:beta-aspartyl-peptidase (threonine type)
LLGAGTYADDTLGACSGTGDGEAFMRLVLAHRAVTLLERDPRAAERAIGELGSRLGALGGLLLVSPRGEASFARNTVTMGFAVVGEGLEDSGT